MISALGLLLLLSSAPSDSTPSCSADLVALDQKLRQDYAGYTLELEGARLQQYQAMKSALETRAARAVGDGCYYVLRDFTDWFDDPHLFIYQVASIDSAASSRRRARIATRVLTEERARAYFARHAAQLDPIEGIWYDRGLRVAIVPDSGARRGRFVAVVLASDTSTWSPGSVRAFIARRGDGSYDVDLSKRNYAITHLHGAIYRHVLLRLSPGIWGKAFPVSAADSGTLDPVDPHRPVLYRHKGTLVFAIPSHDGFKAVIDSMVAAHAAELASADRIIIDLRGNEGGGSGMTDALGPYVMLKHDRPSPYQLDSSLMLSSPDQIAYAKRAFGPDTSAFVRSLVSRLEAHPGELVPLSDPASPPAPADPRDWVIASGPRAVGVLADRGTVSASEVLVVYALQSPRATVFGEPTAGALDYESASIVSLLPNEHRWAVGYGTITRSARLPAGGMRGKGIQPQVPIDLAKVADPVAFVDSALSTRDRDAPPARAPHVPNWRAAPDSRRATPR
ncbi:MAG TPA: S41 family peptidase [Gemmatimonadaceae bacterium]|nr:S41 family peptidase [Gemmatimonadaceae bacterium]